MLNFKSMQVSYYLKKNKNNFDPLIANVQAFIQKKIACGTFRKTQDLEMVKVRVVGSCIELAQAVGTNNIFVSFFFSLGAMV